MSSIIEATDAMFGHAKASLPGGFSIAYPDVPFELASPARWARVTVKLVDGGQRGFGDTTKRYVSIGILCIEVMCKPGDGRTAVQSLAHDVKRYLESVSSSHVWYRNIRAVDTPSDGGYTRINVYANFEFEDNH